MFYFIKPLQWENSVATALYHQFQVRRIGDSRWTANVVPLFDTTGNDTLTEHFESQSAAKDWCGEIYHGWLAEYLEPRTGTYVKLGGMLL